MKNFVPFSSLTQKSWFPQAIVFINNQMNIPKNALYNLGIFVFNQPS